MDSKYPYETICEESEDERLVVSRMKSRIVFCFQVEDKVLRSYTSGDFSCFEGV